MVQIKPKTKLWSLQVPLVKGGNIGTCNACGKHGHMTLDHILPAGVLEPLYADYELYGKEGGIDMVHNDQENIEFLCQYCNQRKGCRMDVRNPKTLPLLKKLIIFLEHEANLGTTKKS